MEIIYGADKCFIDIWPLLKIHPCYHHERNKESKKLFFKKKKIDNYIFKYTLSTWKSYFKHHNFVFQVPDLKFVSILNWTEPSKMLWLEELPFFFSLLTLYYLLLL